MNSLPSEMNFENYISNDKNEKILLYKINIKNYAEDAEKVLEFKIMTDKEKIHIINFDTLHSILVNKVSEDYLSTDISFIKKYHIYKFTIDLLTFDDFDRLRNFLMNFL
jgi:tricorn protease-like protein